MACISCKSSKENSHWWCVLLRKFKGNQIEGNVCRFCWLNMFIIALIAKQLRRTATKCAKSVRERETPDTCGCFWCQQQQVKKSCNYWAAPPSPSSENGSDKQLEAICASICVSTISSTTHTCSQCPMD